jgi:hypothetical protein
VPPQVPNCSCATWARHDFHEKKLPSPVTFIKSMSLFHQWIIELSTRVYFEGLVPRALELVYRLVNGMPTILALKNSMPTILALFHSSPTFWSGAVVNINNSGPTVLFLLFPPDWIIGIVGINNNGPTTSAHLLYARIKSVYIYMYYVVNHTKRWHK